MDLFDESRLKRIEATTKTKRVAKSKWEYQLEPILRDIVEHAEKQSIEQSLMEFYFGACGVYGEIDDWPEDLVYFYGQLQLKFQDKEVLSHDQVDWEVVEKGRNRFDRYVSTKESQIINKIKNKWLSVQGVNFKGRRK